MSLTIRNRRRVRSGKATSPRQGLTHHSREAVLRFSYHVKYLVVRIGQAAARQPADEPRRRPKRSGSAGQARQAGSSLANM